MAKNNGGFKNYVAIITEADERLDNGEKTLNYWVDAPWDGNLVDIVFTNSYSKLKKYEGMFFYMYSTITGERICSGTMDDTVKEQIERYNAYVVGNCLFPDCWHGKKPKDGRYALIVFSTHPHACGRFKPWIPPHMAKNYIKDAPWDGLFEDAVYGDTADLLHYGRFHDCAYQLFDTETGKCIGSGYYSKDAVAMDIERAEAAVPSVPVPRTAKVEVYDTDTYNKAVDFWSNGLLELRTPDGEETTPEQLPWQLRRTYDELSRYNCAEARFYLTQTGGPAPLTVRYHASLIVEYSEDEAEELGVDMETLFNMAWKQAEKLAERPIFSHTAFIMRKDHDEAGYHELNVMFDPFVQKEKFSRAQDVLVKEGHAFGIRNKK